MNKCSGPKGVHKKGLLLYIKSTYCFCEEYPDRYNGVLEIMIMYQSVLRAPKGVSKNHVCPFHKESHKR